MVSHVIHQANKENHTVSRQPQMLNGRKGFCEVMAKTTKGERGRKIEQQNQDRVLLPEAAFTFV